MPPDYVHPEFGYFHPMPRLRRDARLVLCAGLVGVVIGGIGVGTIAIKAGRVVDDEPVLSAATEPAAIAVLQAQPHAPAGTGAIDSGAKVRGGDIERKGKPTASNETAGITTRLPAAQPAPVTGGDGAGEVSASTPVASEPPRAAPVIAPPPQPPVVALPIPRPVPVPPADEARGVTIEAARPIVPEVAPKSPPTARHELMTRNKPQQIARTPNRNDSKAGDDRERRQRAQPRARDNGFASASSFFWRTSR